MNVLALLAAMFVLSVRAGCALVTIGAGTEQPYAPHPYNDDGRMDRSRDMM